MKSTFLFFFIALAIAGCDYVDDPTPPGTGGGGNNGGDTVKRRALLEEFTGHRCNTCPAAHAVAANLTTAYGEDLIVVAIHATNFFAAPVDPPAANGSYSTDFRTPAGDAYATTFNVSFLPTGLVNRVPFNSSTTIGSGNWSSAIAEIVDADAACDIWVDELVYNSGANTVSAVVKVAVLQAITGAHNLTIYLTEDHVIDWQLNSLVSPPDVPNYDHRHVLRTNLTGTWGSSLITASAAVGDTLTLSVPPVSMDPAWNGTECALVAYLYNVSSNEILQATERKFQP
ncbi:MAG: Omp28-related outer membrane protein [Flavobacteriales bacterium]|nr:Omp28-related outer membrane protein [Flavobacteriales bacterium]MCC6937294.1 Omp28-related outer membrane protein [Flavobacteriales bacterium]